MIRTVPLDGVITFPDGLPGFEQARRFVLVVSPTLDPFVLLQGLDPEAPSFLAIDPRRTEPDYPAEIVAADRRRLRAKNDEPLIWLSFVTVRPGGSATINLRAPVVISPTAMRGIQIAPSESAYRLDHPLKAA